MKSFLSLLFAILCLLLVPGVISAQSNDAPVQVLCYGAAAERYCVDCAVSAGSGQTDSTYHWSISTPGFEGVIYDDPAFAGIDSTNHILIDWRTTPPGSYVLTVTETNANGCLGESIEVTIQITKVEASYELSEVLCSDSEVSLEVTASGGIAPYEGVGVFTFFADTLLSQYIVSDSLGCTDTLDVTIDFPSNLVIALDSIVDAGCNGAADGAIYVQLSGGSIPYTYSWSNGPSAEDLTGAPAGSYTLTVTDANNCSADTLFTIEEPDPFTATITAGEPLCFNPASPGAAEFTITGGAGTAGATIQLTYQIGTQTPATATVSLDGSGSAVYTVPNATADVTVTLNSITVGLCTDDLVGESDIVDIRDPIVTSPISHD